MGGTSERRRKSYLLHNRCLLRTSRNSHFQLKRWASNVSFHNTMSDKSTGDSPATSSGQSSSVVVAKRKPIPRKGHTKSRAGCVVCKRRRVKCDEASPECGQCRRLGLECEYLNKKKPASPPESTSLARPLRTAPATFDIDDMRFFRHFLFEAYPPLPIDGGPVWHQVSQLIYEVSPQALWRRISSSFLQYDFLLHAFLAIGASHLNLLSSADYEKAALKHRVLAIKSLNEHLSKSEMSIPDAEAAFGATLALTFQSAYMPDGLPDFLTMVRGCTSSLLGLPDLVLKYLQVFLLGHIRFRTSTLACSGRSPETRMFTEFASLLSEKHQPSFLIVLLRKNIAPILNASHTCAKASHR